MYLASLITIAYAFNLATGATGQKLSTDPAKDGCNTMLNTITGRIYPVQIDEVAATKSLMDTKILVNYGQYVAYPMEDGTFEVNNLTSDSYVIEIAHPTFIYEPARIDLTRQGKIRARRVNYIQPSLVQTLKYPLEFRPKSLHIYFMSRETWRIMDLLMNPVVLMMVVPLFIIWLLPKMMNPQEVQNQRESMQMPDYQVPEISEMIANMMKKQPSGPSQSGAQAITSGGSGSTSHSSSTSKHAKTKRR